LSSTPTASSQNFTTRGHLVDQSPSKCCDNANNLTARCRRPPTYCSPMPPNSPDRAPEADTRRSDRHEPVAGEEAALAKAVAFRMRNAIATAPRCRQRRSAGWADHAHARLAKEPTPWRQMRRGLADLPTRHASRTGDGTPRDGLRRRDEVGRPRTHDDVAEATADGRWKRAVRLSDARAPEACAGKGFAVQPVVSKIDRADVAIAGRAVNFDLKLECGDFIECPKREGAQHAPELRRAGVGIIGRQ
jgi:hypothetical protein